MSHTSIAHTRDYDHTADKGELTNPQQSAGFVSDPLLTPVTASSLPHPVAAAEPSVDPSTHHPNTHYDHSKQLSKKKKAKKLGVGTVPHPHPHSGHVGGRSFAETDRAAHERAERRDHELGAAHDEEGDEEEEDDEDVTEAELANSHNQHHENRITGTEQQRGGTAPADPKPRAAAGQGKEGDKEEGAKGEEGDASKPTLKEKATELLSSAQEKASSVLDAVTQQPMVSSLLSKVGLGGSKAEDSTKETNAQASKEEESA